MSYKQQKEKARLITDLISELDAKGKLRKIAQGAKGEWLKCENHNPHTLSISKFYQRQFSAIALNDYKQFNRELARPIVIAIRPKHLGGAKMIIDGQHTAGLAICSGDLAEVPCHVLYHPEHYSLIDCIEAESRLFHAYNTKRKNPTAIDKIRAGLCFDDPKAMLFNEILEACNLQIDGLGDLPSGDELASAGAARFIKTVDQYGEDYRAYIVKAVNYIRRIFGNKSADFKYRDDLIHGLTTLLVFLDEGRDKKGVKLNGRRTAVLAWLETSWCHVGIQPIVQNTAGGNTHYKIVHKFISFYNNTAEKNMAISTDFLHMNGIWDEDKLENRKERLGKVGTGEYLTANFPDYEM